VLIHRLSRARALRLRASRSGQAEKLNSIILDKKKGVLISRAKAA